MREVGASPPANAFNTCGVFASTAIAIRSVKLARLLAMAAYCSHSAGDVALSRLDQDDANALRDVSEAAEIKSQRLSSGWTCGVTSWEFSFELLFLVVLDPDRRDSSTTLTLVPPKPNELIPAKTGASSGKLVSLVFTKIFSFSKSILGLGERKCKEAGSAQFSKAKSVLAMLTKPAAGSECPKLVLDDPIGSGLRRNVASADPMDPASTGSPTCVPVPWASKKKKSSGSTVLSATTFSIKRVCCKPDGTANCDVPPSVFTPVARTRAR